ncbi:MAG: hypothetical protein PVH29_00245 [Candidatus Zixiibacteriota bacterium]|jgi:hypothetical protein
MLGRLLIVAAVLASYLAGAPAAWAAEEKARPLAHRDLVLDLGPKLPEPEKEALSDPRFAAASRYTTARQISSIAAGIFIVAGLLAFYFVGGPAWVERKTKGRPFAATLLTAGAVGSIPTAVFLAAAVVRAVYLKGAGVPISAVAVVAPPVCYGLGAAAFTFAVGSARTYWPRSWWIAITAAAVAAAVGGLLFLPFPPADRPASPTGGFLAERAQYLSSQYEFTPYEIAVERRGPGAGTITAVALPARRKVVATEGAESLNRYEAEVLLATAIRRAEARQKSLLGAAALVAFMAALLLAEYAAGRLALLKESRRGAPADDLSAFAAVFVAVCLLGLVLFNAWHRHLARQVDEEVVTLTRKPLAAVTLYYREAAANLAAAEPNPILHFLADAYPSPAERAAEARRLRRELARE